MSTRLKFALDALSIALNDENSAISDPRADTEYEHPFGSKGTEPEDVKYGGLKCAACESGDCLPHHKHAELIEMDPDEEDNPICICGHAFYDHGDRSCDLCGVDGCFGFEPRDTEPVPVKIGNVEIHETPRHLPPRDDLRSHLDEDEAKKLKDQGKIGSDPNLRNTYMNRIDYRDYQILPQNREGQLRYYFYRPGAKRPLGWYNSEEGAKREIDRDIDRKLGSYKFSSKLLKKAMDERYTQGEKYWMTLSPKEREDLELPYHHRGMVRPALAFYQQSVPVREAVYQILGI
jgi:hypothetical protein